MKPEQITAWALEEASAEERQQLEAELRDNPKAKQTAEETKEFCHFLLAELRDESLALTDEQRERLKAQPQSSRAVQARRAKARTTNQWRTGVVVRLALAACVVLGGFWTWSVVQSRSTKTEAVAAVDVLRQITVNMRRSEVTQGKIRVGSPHSRGEAGESGGPVVGSRCR
jgi:anti-sigma factor RsiW